MPEPKVGATPDWEWRADFFDQTANYLDAKAEDLKLEAQRYRGLSEQARTLHRIGQHG